MFTIRLAMLSLALPLAAWADEISLIRVGESWRYFRGTTEASSPVAAWREPAFDDSAWPAAPSGFSLTADEATVIPRTASFRSVYFRRPFDVADPAAVKWLVLRLDYDDGFVAYLNGVEILRRGLTNNPVPFDAYATHHPRGTAVDFDVTGATNLLVQGRNVLALQLHASATSPSQMVLVPELLANFQRGPFVQSVTLDGATLEWRTPVAATGEVECWSDEFTGWIFFDRRLTNRHVFTLTALQPGTQYYYRVRSTAGGVIAESPESAFHTAKASGPVSFMVLGDTGGGLVPQHQIASVMATQEVDLVLHCGDVIYPSFTDGYTDTRCLSVYGEHMRTTPYYFTFGNHELYGGSDAPYRDAFNLPRNPVFGTEHFYSFDQGDAHFVSLYIPTRTPFPGMSGYALEVGSPQYDWLTNDLAVTTKPWKILFFHSPLFTSSGHRQDNLDGDDELDRLQLDQILLPVVARYGVQAVFVGHDHNYERFLPVYGMHSFVTGGGGYTLYQMTEQDPASSQFWYRFQCMKVTIRDDRLKAVAIDTAGQEFDAVTIQKAPPPRQVWQASWHAPIVESAPADDGDGNITGQSFDFVGTPIPAVAGDFSNLGQVFVNNDAQSLYLGFRRAMVGPGDDICLFVEVPDLSGVTRLAGLGNGVVDAADEGADGLDFLENLSFTNFAPAVAFLLGDELADGTFRSFRRPAQTVSTGQGVFRLDLEFSSLPGVRVQQFNQSPQVLEPSRNQGVLGEQNADFIELAIPFTALGGLRPGDKIRIGAVVGAGIDTSPDVQARELHRGFLGYSLVGAGWGPSVLEGLTVKLAVSPGFRLYIAQTGPTQYRLSWPATPGTKYHIDAGLAVDEVFQPLSVPGLPRTATSTWEEFDLDVSGLQPKPAMLFFRCRVVE